MLFASLVFCDGNPLVDSFHQGSVMQKIYVFFVAQTVEMPVIWDAIMLM